MGANIMPREDGSGVAAAPNTIEWRLSKEVAEGR